MWLFEQWFLERQRKEHVRVHWETANYKCPQCPSFLPAQGNLLCLFPTLHPLENHCLKANVMWAEGRGIHMGIHEGDSSELKETSVPLRAYFNSYPVTMCKLLTFFYGQSFPRAQKSPRKTEFLPLCSFLCHLQSWEDQVQCLGLPGSGLPFLDPVTSLAWNSLSAAPLLQ